MWRSPRGSFAKIEPAGDDRVLARRSCPIRGSVCVRLLNIGDVSVIFYAIIVDGVVVVFVMTVQVVSVAV